MRRLLWIPHVAREPGARRRDEYFIEHLSRHHEIHCLTWTTYRGTRGEFKDRVRTVLGRMRFSHWREKACWVHGIPRLPSPVTPRYPRSLMLLNQQFLHAAIRRLHDRAPLDAIVCAPNAWLIGFPPFDADVPVVFDYLDCVDWVQQPSLGWAEREYLKRAQAVLAVSHGAEQRAQAFNPRCYYLPNGVDLDLMRAATGSEVRRRLNLEDRFVVSLIGYGTTSQDLYFIEAIQRARRRAPNLVGLLVGRNPVVEERVRQVDPQGRVFVLTGPVGYPEVLDYFKASDVGLYPVEETPYYHAASPIKVFEYSAAGKPVITPRLQELRALGFPNVVFCPPDAESLAEAIVSMMKHPPPACPERRLREFDWANLVRRLEDILEEVITSSPA